MSVGKLLSNGALLFDVLIIGAGPSGLSTATGLARQLHTAVIFDSGVYRNAKTQHMHNVLGWDHRNPAELRAAGRADLISRYSTIQLQNSTIETIKQIEGQQLFEARDARGERWYGRKVVLAVGVRDVPLEIEGYSECWANGIYHCLFCDGYEERGQETAGVLALGPTANPSRALHLARMARQLSKSVTVYTNGNEQLVNEIQNAAEASSSLTPWLKLDARHITRFEKGDIAKNVIVHLGEAGESKTEGFLVYNPQTEINGPFAKQLALNLTEGGDIETMPPFHETSVPGVFAVGDCATPLKAVTPAVAMGSLVAGGLVAQLQAQPLSDFCLNRELALFKRPVKNIMLKHDNNVDNEPSLQDSLLTAHSPTVKVKANVITTESHGSLERNILSGSSTIHVSKDYWAWELFGVLGSAAIFIGIAIILDRFDGKRQPSWEHVSLNSLISWLTTAAKFFVLVPITLSLGQLKWVWFAEKERPLSDLEEFDSASRGIFGSARLLWRLRGRHFAVVGSLAIIMASGLDPFIQNLIHYYPNAVPDPSQLAYLANASTYTAVGALMGGDLNDVNQGLKVNVYNAILKPESPQIWSQPQYVCNTGNCTWGPVASIGICPFCSDISKYLSMSCKDMDISIAGVNDQNCTVSLTNGFATWFVDGGLNGYPMVIRNFLPKDNALVYKNYSLPLIQGIQAVNNDTNQNIPIQMTDRTQFIATECALAPCVRSFQASVRRNIYNESTPSYWYEFANGTIDMTSNWPVTMNPPWGPDRGVQEGQSFRIDFEAFDALSVYIASLLSGNVHVASDALVIDASNTDILGAIFYGDFADCENPLDKISCAINNIAQAMSKSFWDTPYIANGTEGAHMITGDTFVSLPFVRINWGWFAFPLAIWVLSVVTLGGTVWKTRRAQVQKWRNSPLPLVFLHLNKDHEAAGIGNISNAGFATRAKKISVQLHAPEGDTIS